MKNKTNDQMFKTFLKDLHPIEMALLRERISIVMDMTRQSIKESPELWVNPIVHPDIYIGLADKFNKHFKQ